jgi:hypothetical protein
LQEFMSGWEVGPLAGETMADLLWEELVEREQAALGKRAGVLFDAERGSASQYWQRRRRLSAWHRWKTIERRLPAPWPRLLELPPAAARDLVINLGIEMISRSISGMSLHELIHWLGPLGGDVAGRVVDQSRRAKPAPPLPPGVAQHWREACVTAARHVGGEHIPAALGRGLLATMFRKLTPEDRHAAAGMSRSGLAGMLADDSSLEPVSPAELVLAESMAREAIGKVSSTGGMAHRPAPAGERI